MVSRVVHFDVPVDDPQRAGAFYADVFGWTVQHWGPDYWPMTTGEPPGVGAEGALTRRPEAPEGVVVYVSVDDVDKALARIAAAGGTPIGGKLPIPTIGWTARFRDPEGNLIGLFQDDPSAA